jgi:hypothetical protein
MITVEQKSTAALLALLVALAAPAAPLGAEELRLTPSLSLKEEYNDNIYMESSDRKSDFVSTLTPSLEFLRRGELLETQLTARLNGVVYAKGNGPDALDQSYRGRLSYRPTPRLSLGAEGGYTRDSQPDRDLETTGLVIKSKYRKRMDGQGTLQLVLSETTDASISYAFNQELYDDPATSDIRSHTATLVLTRDLSGILPLTKGRLIAGYATYDFDTSSVDNWSLMTGVSRSLDEVWSVQLDAGGRRTRTKTEYPAAYGGDESDSSWGWVARLSLAYSGEFLSGNISFNRDMTAASGRNGATERTSLTASASRRLTAELSANLSVGYFINNSKGGGSDYGDEDTLNAGMGVSWKLNLDTQLEAGYQYNRIMYSGSQSDVDRHRLYLRLVMNWPLLQ